MKGNTKNKHTGKKGEWLRVQIISEKITGKFKAIPALFCKPVFIAVSITELIWLLFILFHYSPQDVSDIYINLSASQTGMWIICVAFISIVHECGHVSALLHCGETPGGIGIGFYYLLPRAWSEVNNTWRLPERERLYVNAGGNYVQLLLTMSVFFLNIFLINSRSLLAACISSAQMSLINLLPNKGMDGYWILRDSFGIENISERAAALLKNPRQNKSEPGGKAIIVLFIVRNAVLIYLLVLAVKVSSSALIELYTGFSASQTGLGSFTVIHQYVYRRIGCFVVLTVVLQNVITSVIQMCRHENAL